MCQFVSDARYSVQLSSVNGEPLPIYGRWDCTNMCANSTDFLYTNSHPNSYTNRPFYTLGDSLITGSYSLSENSLPTWSLRKIVTYNETFCSFALLQCGWLETGSFHSCWKCRFQTEPTLECKSDQCPIINCETISSLTRYCLICLQN